MGKQIIVCGADQLGKTSLIEAIIEQQGYRPVIHYSKPKKLEIYDYSVFSPEYEYQYHSFINGFQLIDSKVPLIFDRFHLGEYVYSSLYRGYDGAYVFDLEKQFDMANQEQVVLILLTTSTWSFIEDDGQSFDFNRKHEEQERFIEAFNRSIIPNKVLIDINNNGHRKSSDEILDELTGVI